MKYLVFYTALLGMVLLVIRFIGAFVEIDNANTFLFVGLGLLIFVSLPLQIVKQKRDRKRIKEILSKYKDVGNQRKKDTSVKKKTGNYPHFGEQKRGLTWGGGNVHGANAQRGSKKGFLR